MSARRIYVGRRFVLGEFRCSPDDELWRQENVIGPPGVSVATFPITSVVIRHERQEAFLANPNHVVFYRRGERYRRALHDERGDACLFVDFDARTAAELGGGEGEIPIAYGPSDAKAYLRLRLAARAARAGAGSALDQLARSDGLLTKLAVELGFNSHSHLAVAFRSVFGASPSEIRASYGRRRLAELPGTLAAPGGRSGAGETSRIL